MLLKAAGDGDEAQIHELISKDIDLLAQDAEGKTVLHIASSKGHVSVVKMLATAGGFDLVEQRSRIGRTELEFATFFGHNEVEQVLRQLETSMVCDKQQQQDMLAACRLLAFATSVDWVS